MSTKIGPYTITKIPLNCPVPYKWRKLARGEAFKWQYQLNPVLGQWGIAALDVGKIHGWGYGN